MFILNREYTSILSQKGLYFFVEIFDLQVKPRQKLSEVITHEGNDVNYFHYVADI